MNQNPDWKIRYEHEIAHAIASRQKGNEGMARVCARRAAGIIIGEYLSRRGFDNLSPSAYDRLRLLKDLPDVDRHVKDISGHFLLKVNHTRNLPMDTDLVSEAQWLVKTLLLANTN